MANENEKETNELKEEKTQQETKVEKQKVEKKKIEIDFNLQTLSSFLSIIIIALQIFAGLFAVAGVSVVYQIFVWLSGLTMIANLAIYFVDAVQTKEFSTKTHFVLMLVALATFVF